MDSNGGIMYETLDAFSFFGNSEPEPDPDPAESYAVFRNQITSTADLSVDIPVADYFSLDDVTTAVAAETPRCEVEESNSFPTVDRANGGGNASELAWFRGGSRFKSPMIQLHKGKIFLLEETDVFIFGVFNVILDVIRSDAIGIV